jgi:hypothetical protein
MDREKQDSIAASHASVVAPLSKVDADEALKAFGNGEIIELSAATGQRLLRRIDWNIMPVSICLRE